MLISRCYGWLLIIATCIAVAAISGCVIQVHRSSIEGELIDGHPNIDRALEIISTDERLFSPLRGVEVIAVRDLNVRYNPAQPTCDKRDTPDRCFPKCTTDYKSIYIALFYVESSVWKTVGCILHENYHQQGGGEAAALQYAADGTLSLRKSLKSNKSIKNIN